MGHKTIYLQRKPYLFSIAFFILGISFSTLFFAKYWSAQFEIFDLIYLFVGCFELFFSITFFPKFQYVPKLSLDQQKVFVKPDIWRKSYSIKWNDISRIMFGSYCVSFVMKNGVEKQLEIPYLKEISLEIKSALKEASEYQNIQIVRI